MTVALCSARRTDGTPCGNHPVRGGAVCWKHGGNARQVRAAANRRLIDEEARNAVVTYGLPIDIDPADALLEEVCRTAGHVAWLERQVRALSPDQLVWGKAEEVEKGASEFPGTDTTQKAAPNVWVVLYRDERQHLVAVCKAAIAADIDERRVRLAERQGALLAEVIRSLLEDPELGLSRRQQEVGRVVASRHLQVLSAAP
jgi:hypothetical protein